MNILYFGSDSYASTSSHRVQALRRIGQTVNVVDIAARVPRYVNTGGLEKFHFRTGYRLLQPIIRSIVKEVIASTHQPPDLIWIDSGELFGPTVLQFIRKKLDRKVLLFNLDDPTGYRDGGRFSSLRRAMPFYDLGVTVRKETEDEMRGLGVKHVLNLFRTYDEVAHLPFDTMADIPSIFRSDISFIGTWMRYEARDKFILELVERGLSVSVWGGRWQKSPMWDQLVGHYRGGALAGRDYVAAIQGAKICIGMLSKGNRDLHTHRSAEVPFAGGLLCAERTSEHLQMYEEGKEAVFWSSAAECAQICQSLLADDERRERIRLAGMRKVRQLKLGNEDLCRQILNAVKTCSLGSVGI